MLQNVEIRPQEIDIQVSGPEDLKQFDRITGVDPHLYHLHALPNIKRPPMVVTYHIPSDGTPVYRRSTGAELGAPRVGETQYHVTLKALESDVPKLRDASVSHETTQFFYEDVKELAHQLTKEKLISEVQQKDMVSLARTTLDAEQTLFFPNKESPLLEVNVGHGHFKLRVLTDSPNFDSARVQDAIQEFANETERANINTGPAHVSIDDYPGHRETIENLAESLIKHKLLPADQREQFINEVRTERVRNFARQELSYVPTNLSLGKIYSDGNFGVTQERYTETEVTESMRYLRIIKALADTGDFNQIDSTDLQVMKRVADVDNYQDNISQTWAHALLRETVQIQGRSQGFEKLCSDYHTEIEAALNRQQVEVIAADGSPVGPNRSMVVAEPLPKDIKSLAEVLTTRDKETDECLIDQWAKAGNYERIKQVIAPLANADWQSGGIDGRSEEEVVFNCLAHGNRYGADREKSHGILESLGNQHDAVKAIFEGLASGKNNSVLEQLTSHIQRHHPELLSVIGRAAPLNWEVTTANDDGVFRKFPPVDLDGKKDFGDTVYKFAPATTSAESYMRDKGFGIVRHKEDMAKGLAFFDDGDMHGEEGSNHGTIYAYKHDLEKYLGVVASPSSGISIAGAAPASLSASG